MYLYYYLIECISMRFSSFIPDWVYFKTFPILYTRLGVFYRLYFRDFRATLNGMNTRFLHKIIIAALVLGGVLGALYLLNARTKVSFIESVRAGAEDNAADADRNQNADASASQNPSELSGDASNPYRGWYQINQYRLSDHDFPDETAITESLDLSDGMRLSLAEFNLAEYAGSALSETALDEIRTVLSAARAQQIGLIVRFLYDWDGNAAEAEPDERSIVEGHIRQTAPLINEYKDIIFCMQGIFVGDYGEMHDSAFLGENDSEALFGLLADQTDPDLFLSVRTPEQWRNLTGVSNPSRSAQTPLSGRTGLFNDGIMASDTDLGTYAENARAKELSFQNVLCRIVPNGGEALNDNSLNDIPAAIDTLRAMRISYLNPEYDAAVMDKWKHSEYEGENAYAYIGAHLGYRYELAKCDGKTHHHFRDLFAPSMDFSITVLNTGFAPAYRRYDMELVLSAPDNTQFQELLSVPVLGDNREWMPDEAFSLKARIGKKDFQKVIQHLTSRDLHEDTLDDSAAPTNARAARETDSVSLWLRLKDPASGEVIRFAGQENDADPGIFLGRLSLGS